MPDSQAVISGVVTRPRSSDVRHLLITWHPSGHDHLLSALPPQQDGRADCTRQQLWHARHEEGELAPCWTETRVAFLALLLFERGS